MSVTSRFRVAPAMPVSPEIVSALAALPACYGLTNPFRLRQFAVVIGTGRASENTLEEK